LALARLGMVLPGRGFALRGRCLSRAGLLTRGGFIPWVWGLWDSERRPSFDAWPAGGTYCVQADQVHGAVTCDLAASRERP
jgi:hypothetical protein